MIKTPLILLTISFNVHCNAHAQVSPPSVDDQLLKRNSDPGLEGEYAIPAQYQILKGLSIQIEKRSDMYITCILVNNTDYPVTFYGYRVTHPCYMVQQQIDGQWVDKPIGWMDYGKMATLSAKRCSRFAYPYSHSFKLRLGISVVSGPDGVRSSQGLIVWSDTFEPFKIKGEQAAPSNR